MRIVRVRGSSMSPTFDDGDFALVLGRCSRRALRVGSVVVVAHSSLGLMIKRVVARAADGGIKLGGDNALSIASDDIGFVERSAIVGVVYFRITPDGGVSRVRGAAGQPLTWASASAFLRRRAWRTL